MLADFMDRLELPNGGLVLVKAGEYLPALNHWLSWQIVASEDRVSLITRVGYFVGEYLQQRHGGEWFLNDIPNSRYFARYVVGRFPMTSNANAMVDPFEVAEACISAPLGRSISRVLEIVELEIAQA